MFFFYRRVLIDVIIFFVKLARNAHKPILAHAENVDQQGVGVYMLHKCNRNAYGGIEL